jgi:DNA-binding NarL/FixJ family response regulator
LRGESTSAISEELFISTSTVRNHVNSILTKMGAHSKLEAVTMAQRERLIT